MSDGITVTSIKGVHAEVLPIALCVGGCGWTAHRTGTHGSWTCIPCETRAAEKLRAIHEPTRDRDGSRNGGTP
jgi:hypothetical protein